MTVDSVTEVGRGTQSGTAGRLAAAMALVVIGMDTFIVQPGFVQGLVDHAGFRDQDAGYIASMEMFGITATTVAMTWLSRRVRLRTLVFIALVLDAIANVLCIGTDGFHTFAALRFVVGLASGVLISVGYAAVGLSSNPDRNFGLLIVCVLTYGAFGLLALPTVFTMFGLKAVLAFLAFAPVLGLLALRLLGNDRSAAIEATRSEDNVPRGVRALLLGGILFYFLAQGAIWPFLSLIGIASGGTERQVANALTVSQFLGIAGAWTAATAGARWRHSTSLTAGVVGGVLPLFAFLAVSGAFFFGLGVGLFNYAANFITPLLMAIVAGFDRSGRLVVQAVALQMLGLAAGPALGAAVIEPGNYVVAIWISIGLFVACLVTTLPPILARARRRLPIDGQADSPLEASK